jgi:plasmid stabilization system protein ParE
MIFFAPEAISDVQQLYDFLESENPDAAKRAMTAIYRKLELVENMPGLGIRTRSAFIRQTVIRFGKRGYIARYTVRERDGAMIVLRIWHGREIQP